MRKFLIASLLVAVVFGFKVSIDGSEPWPKPELRFFPAFPKHFTMPTRAQVDLGRYLFYDPILSADSAFSCSSCHNPKQAFSDAGEAFSTGISGEMLTRNTPALFNLIWNESFFWDGRSASLSAQALHPVRDPNEMGLSWTQAEKRIRASAFYGPLFRKAYPDRSVDSLSITAALAAFQSILFSQDSKYDRVLRGEDYFSPQEYLGYTLVNLQNKGDCLQCHPTDPHALGTTGKFANNGLENAQSASDYPDSGRGLEGPRDRNGWFKVPSLRNLAFSAPYMHDGRFETLEEVLDFYSEGLQEPYNADSKLQHAHKGGARLTKAEKEAILAFLSTLNDSVFIDNPLYANPF